MTIEESYSNKARTPKEAAERAKKARGQLYIFAGCTLLIYALAWLAVYFRLSQKVLFYLLPAFFLGCGIIYTFLMQKHYTKLEKDAYPFGLLFTLCLSAICFATVFLTIRYLPQVIPSPVLLSSMCLFPLPYLLWNSWRANADIPLKSYESWVYPLNTEPPDELLLNTPKVFLVKLTLRTNPNSRKRKTLDIRAPKEMPLGKLVHLYIAKYNRENPDNKIEFKDHYNEFYNWYFYSNKFLGLGRNYYRPSHAVTKNLIKSGIKIHAVRA